MILSLQLLFINECFLLQYIQFINNFESTQQNMGTVAYCAHKTMYAVYLCSKYKKYTRTNALVTDILTYTDQKGLQATHL